jgi:hypothetical protein
MAEVGWWSNKPFPARRLVFLGNEQGLASLSRILFDFSTALPLVRGCYAMQTGADPFPATRFKEVTVRIAITKPLFAWDCLQDSPSLAAVKAFLASVPDARLLEMLRQSRGRGRNDYPVGALWGVVLLRIALRHGSFEATLGELSRNEALRRLIGLEEEQLVPKSWNVSRFLDV